MTPHEDGVFTQLVRLPDFAQCIPLNAACSRRPSRWVTLRPDAFTPSRACGSFIHVWDTGAGSMPRAVSSLSTLFRLAFCAARRNLGKQDDEWI